MQVRSYTVIAVVLIPCIVKLTDSISCPVFGCPMLCLLITNLLFFSFIVQNLDAVSFTACVKDLQQLQKHHDPITVQYIAFGGKGIMSLGNSLQSGLKKNKKSRGDFKIFENFNESAIKKGCIFMEDVP